MVTFHRKTHHGRVNVSDLRCRYPFAFARYSYSDPGGITNVGTASLYACDVTNPGHPQPVFRERVNPLWLTSMPISDDLAVSAVDEIGQAYLYETS